MRDKLVQWMFKLSQELHLKVETIQSAISVLDLFLTTAKATKSVLQLLGVVCVMIAIKFNETRQFTLQDALFQLDRAFKISEVQMTEVYILQKIG